MLHILLNPVSILLMNRTKAWWWWSWPKHDDDDLSHWSFLKYFNFSVSFQSPTADREACLLWLDFLYFCKCICICICISALYLYLGFFQRQLSAAHCLTTHCGEGEALLGWKIHFCINRICLAFDQISFENTKRVKISADQLIDGLHYRERQRPSLSGKSTFSYILFSFCFSKHRIFLAWVVKSTKR